jgi:hypothetical protein
VSDAGAARDANSQNADSGVPVDAGQAEGGQTDAKRSFRYVFVTSGTYDGIISSENEGSVKKADEICRGLADMSSLDALRNHQWYAWLSTMADAAGTRISNGPLAVRYVLPGSNQTVFEAGDDLSPSAVSAPIARPRVAIDVMETGESLRRKVLVWTGTSKTGYAVINCANWSVNNTASFGTLGLANASNTEEWTETTDISVNRSCDQKYHLYCFEGP